MLLRNVVRLILKLQSCEWVGGRVLRSIEEKCIKTNNDGDGIL